MWTFVSSLTRLTTATSPMVCDRHLEEMALATVIAESVQNRILGHECALITDLGCG